MFLIVGLLVSLSASDVSCTYEDGFDYQGDDVGSAQGAKTEEECCAACEANAACYAWTLWTGGPSCYLKRDAKGRRAVSDHISGVVHGKPPTPPPTPPPPTPPTPPPTPSIKDPTDCLLRSFVIEYAAKVNSNIDKVRAAQMAAALAGDPKSPKGCNITIPPSIPARRSILRPAAPTHNSAAGSSIFADATKGSDEGGDGTIGKPFKTVARALAAARAAGPSSPRTINLRAGIYFLTRTIALTPADGGLTIQTYPGDSQQAWLSGAVPLTGVKWTKNQAGGHVWSADLSGIEGLAAVGVGSLRVGGQRMILARYPNCDPERQLCMNTHNSPPTTLTASKWLAKPGNRTARYTAPSSTSRSFSCPNASWCRGCDVEYTVNYAAGGSGDGSGCALLTPPISHFCSQGGANSGVEVGLPQLPHQPYADPTGARFSAMHGGSWCSFAYEVGRGGYAYDAGSKTGRFAFSGGGQQCNRQETSHGATVVENVAEELDAPGEFHYDTRTRTLSLWYNGTASAGPPTGGAGVVAVPALATLVAAAGTQARPVTGIALRNLGLRDTATTVMAPHMGPSGGDWSVNRNASVVLGGVKSVAISGCTFWKLDNAGVFIGGFARDVDIAGNEFAWLGESAVVSVGDTKGAPIAGWGVDGTDGNQPRGTRLWHNYAHELGIINKQSAFYFQAVTSGADVRGNVAFNGARSAANFNDCFGTGSNFSENVLFNFNRETADHGPFNAWDRVPFVPRKDASHPDRLSRNLIWCNFNSANAFDTDDTSSYFEMTRNVQVYGWFLKSDFGGSEITFDTCMAVFGGQSNQYQPIPPGNRNRVANSVLLPFEGGANLQGRAPCPDSTTPGVPIEFTNVSVYLPGGQESTVCGKGVAEWRKQGLLTGVEVKQQPATPMEVVQMARELLEG